MKFIIFPGHALAWPRLLLSAVLAAALSVGQANAIGFSFRTTVGGETSDALEFGLLDDALQGLDEYDVPEPPKAPGVGFDSYLAMFDAPASLPNRWRRDYRPTVSLLTDRIELWQYEVHSDAVGDEMTIDIDALGPIPVPYELYIFGPGIYYEPVLVPDSLTIPVVADEMILFWELRLADAVVNEYTTWGGVKSLFR